MQNVEGNAGSAGTESHAWETGLTDVITDVGLDVHKATVSVAVAESGPLLKEPCKSDWDRL